MIRGGVTAAGKTGGMFTGFSARYLPCKGYVASSVLRNAFTNKTGSPVSYAASARIRNLTDTAWVDLPTVTYFQVVRRTVRGTDTAFITLVKPETWGVYGTQAGLLRPSVRQLQLFVSVSVAGSTFTTPVFIGSIKGYYESQGGNSASINLTCADARESLSRTASVSYSGSQTAYRLAIRQGVSNLRYFGKDFIAGDLLIPYKADLLRSTIAGIPALSVSAYGPLYVGEDLTGTNDGITFEYDDDSVTSLNRKLDNANSFNTVVAWGRETDELSDLTQQTVTDATDVLLRGTIQYPFPVGGAYMAIADAVKTANEIIANSLYGQVAVEIPLNPFLEPGTTIGISSAKMGLPASRLGVQEFNHQYSVGSARTYINQASVVPI